MPDTSLFWYFYSSTQYNKVVYSGIGLSHRHHRIHEYIDATFKSSWQGSQSKWFLVDMHVKPQWANMQLYPPLVDKKQGEPKMTPCLAALVKQVAELRTAGLRACHYVEEFTLWWIRPLAVGRNWHMTARGLPICVTNLLLVRCSIFTSTIDDQLI
jgi:hypothetical protein